LCTGLNIFQLESSFVHWNKYISTGIECCALEKNIFNSKNLVLCFALMGHRKQWINLAQQKSYKKSTGA